MNGHADVTTLLDATTGDIKATYYYDAFGTIVEETNGTLQEGEKVDNPFRYSGYQYDEETELYYLNARMYDSKIARFMQEDTYRGKANDPLSLNLYTYCTNNPLIYYDPTGHVADFIQRGAKNNDVKSVQQMLISKGYNLGSCGADGIFGKATEAAVKQYQKDNGLKQDGIVGQQTLTSLTSGKKVSVGKITTGISAPTPTTPSKNETPKVTVVPTPSKSIPKPKPQTNKNTNDAGSNSNTGNTTSTQYIVAMPEDFVYTTNYPNSAQAVIERTERTEIEIKGIEMVDAYIKDKIYNVAYKDMCVDRYTIDDHSLLSDYYLKKDKIEKGNTGWYVLAGVADLAINISTKGFTEGIISMFSPDPSITGIVGTFDLENSKKLKTVERQINYLESNAFEHFITYDVASERLIDKLVEYKEELVKIDFSDAYGDSAREFKQAMFDYVNEIIYINENYKESKTAIEKKLDSFK